MKPSDQSEETEELDGSELGSRVIRVRNQRNLMDLCEESVGSE